MSTEIDFNELRAQVLEEIKAGKPLFGKEGAFAPRLFHLKNRRILKISLIL